MEELLELKAHIRNKNYEAALGLVEELEEMSREDKINKIDSFLIILLLHLIKQDVENRSTRSWDRSIDHAARNINKTNKRRNACGFYLNEAELQAAIADAYPVALKDAAVEACEGQFSDRQLAEKVQAASIRERALKLIFENGLLA